MHNPTTQDPAPGLDRGLVGALQKLQQHYIQGICGANRVIRQDELAHFLVQKAFLGSTGTELKASGVGIA